jgi:acetamidase/formamidase
VDNRAGTIIYPWGLTVPLSPFFGIVGVAPAGPDTLHSGPPGPHGGNLDNRYLTTGTTLYLDVFQPEALVSFGDGHGAQGDGEVGGTAAEMPLSARVRLEVLRERRSFGLMAESADACILLANALSVEDALERLVERVRAWLIDINGLDASSATITMSLAVDFQISQLVNGMVTAHAVIPKGLLRPVDGVTPTT